MRGNSAGDTADHDTAATPTPLIRNCRKCGSHFASDFEESLCWQCIAWAELWACNADQARQVSGSRGGRAR